MISFQEVSTSITSDQFNLHVSSSTESVPMELHGLDVNVTYSNVSWVQINIVSSVIGIDFSITFYNCGEFAIILL